MTTQENSPAFGMNRTLGTAVDLLHLREESEHTALICGEGSFSYRQLAADAKRIAYHLMKQGIQKGDRVLLTVRDPLNVVRAMYGILFAGGVYVAADVRWPDERLRQVSEEAGVSFRITDEIILKYLQDECQEVLLPVIKEEDEAAVYYTSGSSGMPKGTVLHHRVLLARADPAGMLPEFVGVDRFLTFPVFSSITSAMAVFISTGYGKTLIFTAPQEMASIDRLVDCMIRNRVQSVGGTPSFLLRALEHPGFAKVIRQQVKLFWTGGELLKGSDAEKLYSAMENGVLDDGYGSSEVYHCSMAQYRPGKGLHLERFPTGVELYVVDENLNPVSFGEEGELLVAGVSARYGHYLDPELNRNKYVDHPVYGRCFCTGDGARLDEEGNIILSGRIDRMIKLHGLRIEPGEVEAAMERYDGILRSAVALKKDRLCGYYTAEEEVEESSLRKYLSAKLPYFMIPSVIIRMEDLPISRNGKLDYKALPEPEKSAFQSSAPENDQEKLLCRIFGEVLGTETLPGADDSFFSLGGDSIHALRVAALLEKEGYSLEVKDIFTAPTPRLLAPLLSVRTDSTDWEGAAMSVPEEIRRTVSEVIDWDDVENVYPASAVVETYIKNNNNTWPQVYCFEIGTDISPEQIETAMQEVSRNHTALRSLILPAGNGHFCQVVLKTPRSRFFRTDLSALSEGEGLSKKQKDYLSTLIRMEYSPSTELGKKTLLRIGHIRLSKERAFLYIGSSHLTMEVISIERIFGELTGRVGSRPDAEAMNRHMARLMHADRSGANAYWENLLKGCDSYTTLPEKTVSSKNEGKIEFIYSSCGHLLFEKARDFCRTNQVTFSALLGYCLGKSLMKNLSLKDVCFPMTGSGRSASEIELPGMFVVAFPLRLTETDTVFTCQNQLLASGEHAWVWADPAYSSLSGKPLFLRTTHGGSSAEEQQRNLYMELFDPKQMNEALGGYQVFGESAVRIRAESGRELSWNMLFDSACHDPALIRNLSAEWIRQLKACVGTDTASQ